MKITNIDKNKLDIKLFKQDCIEGMLKHLQPGSVDVVVTSPPYNLGIKYSTYNDKISRRAYLEWISDWAVAVKRVLDDEGSVFLNIGSKPSDPWVPYEVIGEMRKVFELQNVIHWIKAISIEKKDVGDAVPLLGNIGIGHFKPINSSRFLNDCHEFVFHLTKSGNVSLDRLAIGVEYQDKSNIGRWKSAKKDLRCRGNTWFVPYDTIQNRQEERPHPATFPSELARKCILLHGLEKTRLVMDPFMGLGHAGAAAVSLGLSFMGFEIDETYFREAKHLINHAEIRLPAQRTENLEDKTQLVMFA